MRTKSSRILRIEAEMQRVLAELIAREVKDPRVGSVTVTAVDLAPDLSEARVFFLPFGGKHTGAEVSAGLTRAAGYLRGEVGRGLALRHAPRLSFVLDEQFERAERLSALIDSAARQDEASHRDDVAVADPEPPAVSR
jgi:ribosome-binding factor A